MTVTFERISTAAAEAITGQAFPPLHSVIYAGIENGRPVGVGGVYWLDGQGWMFFNAIDISAHHARHVVRWAQRMLRMAHQVGDAEVMVVRDADAQTSERLLTMIGFSMLGVALIGDREMEIWSNG